MFKIIKIDTLSKAHWFSREFDICSGHQIPPNYFSSGETYAFRNKKGLIGGYSLIHHKHKRTLLQIPLDSECQVFDSFDLKAYSTEITGYFIFKGESGFLLTCHFFWRVFSSPHKYFIYSYDKSNKLLEKLYGYGKPIRIYSGVVKNLDGMTGINYENIEVITRLGFLRLWINRIIRKIIIWKLH